MRSKWEQAMDNIPVFRPGDRVSPHLRVWSLNGKRHCEHGAAIEHHDGTKEYWLNDKKVQPEDVVDYNLAKDIFCYYDEKIEQIIFYDKKTEQFIYGERMDKEFACWIDGYEDRLWYRHGNLHRKDGPAIDPYLQEKKEWFLNGKRHRTDGPAIDHKGGDSYWCLDGEYVEPEDVVDYNLAKGVFCYYDNQAQQLIFKGDNND